LKNPIADAERYLPLESKTSPRKYDPEQRIKDPEGAKRKPYRQNEDLPELKALHDAEEKS
jgi:hypothetical protein